MNSIDSLCVKVQKLLAMANDASSPKEAITALKMARHLMDKHQLDETKISAAASPEALTQSRCFESKKRYPLWQQTLVIGIGRLNDCRVSLDRESSNGHSEPKKTILFQGYKSDVDTAMLMYDYLIKVIENLARAYRGRRAREFFRKGFVNGVGLQIDTICAQRNTLKTTNGRSLVVKKLDQVEKTFGPCRYRTVKKTKTYHSEEELGAYQAGVRTGRNSSLGGMALKKEPRLLT